MKAVDHTGKVYGRLTAICYTGRSGSRGRIWRFICVCGNTTEISASLAKTGHTQSCGCLLKTTPQTQRMDRAGSRNGRLTFVRQTRADKNGSAVWLARCDCGGYIETPTPYKTASCGCARRERLEAKARDMTGARQGLLLFVERVGYNKHGQIRWKAQCDCGKTTVTVKKDAMSCGCLRGKERAKQMRARAMSPEQREASRRESNRKAQLRKKQDPIYCMRMRISHLHSRALRKVGATKKSPTLEALGYTAEQLANHIERQFSKGMSWHNRHEWHIDHIIPMSTAKTVEDVVALNQLSNLRPLWAAENIRKKDKRTHLI